MRPNGPNGPMWPMWPMWPIVPGSKVFLVSASGGEAAGTDAEPIG